MSGLLLTPQERDRFGAYLKHEIESHRGMAKTMEQSGMPMMDVMVKREKQLAAAKIIVLKDLLAGEDYTVG